MSPVFVYGTLRKGFEFHRFIQDSHFRGYGTSAERYALYLAEYPCVLKAPAVSHIRGEVYEVDASTLARLDELEGHPHEYRREVIQVVLDDDSLLKAWIYFYPEPYGFPEVSGDYALCVENTE